MAKYDISNPFFFRYLDTLYDNGEYRAIGRICSGYMKASFKRERIINIWRWRNPLIDDKMRWDFTITLSARRRREYYLEDLEFTGSGRAMILSWYDAHNLPTPNGRAWRMARAIYNGEVEVYVQCDKEPTCFKVKECRKCRYRDALNKNVIRALKAAGRKKVCKKMVKEQKSDLVLCE